MFRDSIFCTAARFSCHHILAHSIGSYHIIPNVLCGRNCLSHKKDGAASFSGRALCGICWKSSDLSGGGAERVQLSDCLRQWKRQYPMAGGVQARVVGWCSLKNEKTHGQTWSPSGHKRLSFMQGCLYKCNQFIHILNSLRCKYLCKPTMEAGGICARSRKSGKRNKMVEKILKWWYCKNAPNKERSKRRNL